MTIVYEFDIIALCPVDGTTDRYEATIRTNTMVSAEHINAVASSFTESRIFQEALTVEVHNRLCVNGSLTTVGTHSGVRVTVTVES